MTTIALDQFRFLIPARCFCSQCRSIKQRASVRTTNRLLFSLGHQCVIPVWLVALVVGLSVDWVFIFFSIFHGMDDYLVLAKESGSSLCGPEYKQDLKKQKHGCCCWWQWCRGKNNKNAWEKKKKNERYNKVLVQYTKVINLKINWTISEKYLILTNAFNVVVFSYFFSFDFIPRPPSHWLLLDDIVGQLDWRCWI